MFYARAIYPGSTNTKLQFTRLRVKEVVSRLQSQGRLLCARGGCKLGQVDSSRYEKSATIRYFN